MVKKFLALALVAVVAAPASVKAALTVQALYADAMAKENAVREALSAQSASETVLKALRTAVATYESLVRRYPTSSYSDNALWQAARLSLDGFGRFGQPQDRDAGIRLLKALASEYPTSKFASQVPEHRGAAPKESPERRQRGRSWRRAATRRRAMRIKHRACRPSQRRQPRCRCVRSRRPVESSRLRHGGSRRSAESGARSWPRSSGESSTSIPKWGFTKSGYQVQPGS